MDKKYKCNHISTKEKILKVAEHIFATKGYKSATIRDISKKAKTNIALINYYFKSKSDLYKKLILKKNEVISNFLDVILNDETLNSEQRFDKFIDFYANFIFDNPELAHILLREMSTDTEHAKWFINYCVKKNFQKIKKIIHDSYKDKHIKEDIRISVLLPTIIGSLAVNVILLPLINIIFEGDDYRVIEKKERIEEIKSVIFNGIKKT